ncbi:hypothetical protein UFOVP9_55 [uncultured Caudovirales phage]|jgi:hypothetical protein|uniref:Uncharacterized protein n=1 Tax=uncultured Caudovirales phage TaxID=2100421 RepID=A0A6J5KIU1_9CAUD|nr:hypothetical protein UFOVP9_55 [uncultured Caudovirales phage]
MDGLPGVTQAQIKAMNKKAEEMFGTEVEQPDMQLHPMLQMPPMPQQQMPAQLQSTTPQQFMQAQEEDAPEVREEIVQEVDEDAELDQPVKPETNREYNMRIMREELAREKRERETAERERDRWHQQAMTKSQVEYEEDEYEEEEEEEVFFKRNNLEDDSLVEAKHLKELLRRDKEREKRQLKLEQEYRSEISRMKVSNSLPDFDLVCSNENFTQLRQMNPVLAQTIYNMPDSYEKKELAYTMVKQLGIYKDNKQEIGLPSTRSDNKDQALKNAFKPRVSASVSPQKSESPLMRANAFASGRSKELDAIALREMREASRIS